MYFRLDISLVPSIAQGYSDLQQSEQPEAHLLYFSVRIQSDDDLSYDIKVFLMVFCLKKKKRKF